MRKRSLLWLMPLLALTCCSRKVYLPVSSERVTSDTLFAASRLTDSVTVRDSVIVNIRGDTIIREVWRYRERLRDNGAVRRETVRDTVRIPVVAVPEKLGGDTPKISLRQKIESAAGKVAVTAIIIILTAVLSRRHLKQKRT